MKIKNKKNNKLIMIASISIVVLFLGATASTTIALDITDSFTTRRILTSELKAELIESAEAEEAFEIIKDVEVVEDPLCGIVRCNLYCPCGLVDPCTCECNSCDTDNLPESAEAQDIDAEIAAEEQIIEVSQIIAEEVVVTATIAATEIAAIVEKAEIAEVAEVALIAETAAITAAKVEKAEIVEVAVKAEKTEVLSLAAAEQSLCADESCQAIASVCRTCAINDQLFAQLGLDNDFESLAALSVEEKLAARERIETLILAASAYPEISEMSASEKYTYFDFIAEGLEDKAALTFDEKVKADLQSIASYIRTDALSALSLRQSSNDARLTAIRIPEDTLAVELMPRMAASLTSSQPSNPSGGDDDCYNNWQDCYDSTYQSMVNAVQNGIDAIINAILGSNWQPGILISAAWNMIGDLPGGDIMQFIILMEALGFAWTLGTTIIYILTGLDFGDLLNLIELAGIGYMLTQDVLDGIASAVQDHCSNADLYCDDATCFLADTKIPMADGNLKNIQDIEVGDLVQSMDLSTGEFAEGEVINVFHHPAERMKQGYLIIDGLKVTPEHPFFVDGEWVEARDLKVGDAFGDGIDSISYVPDAQLPSFNFEVGVYHNYMVSDGLVHNMNAGVAESTTATITTVVSGGHPCGEDPPEVTDHPFLSASVSLTLTTTNTNTVTYSSSSSSASASASASGTSQNA